ncbi:MAG TPA: hypothetical protein VMN38_11790 [Sphingomicrobium sp.]|nr:hypothetical protein [Sphingomicrobium sp.]
MPLSEWASFQDKYEEIFTGLSADERMALFIRTNPSEDDSTLLIPSHNAEMVERLSPGGWEDYADPAQQRWVLLVGNANAADRFGLELGSD